MKAILVLLTILVGPFLWQKNAQCSLDNRRGIEPQRLVTIKGTAKITNLPGVSTEVPATSETLIFQRVGCESCFVGTHVDVDGNYKILVGDGKYKLIVHSPSAPEVDFLAPGQEKFIDTESVYNVTATFTFDIKLKLPQ
jgi:hypothetical protein